MTFDVEIKLLEKLFSTNEYLEEIITYKESIILAIKKSVNRREFYMARQNDLKPSIVFEINSFEYNNEELLIFENKNYKILKTYELNNGLLELTCEEVE